MLYLDTCVLVPLFVAEPGSLLVEERIRASAAGELSISRWCKTEFSSALALKTRRGDIRPAVQQQAFTAFQHFVSHHVNLFETDAQDFELASAYCENWQSGLRAGDALHLSIALRRGATILSLDEKLVDAAQSLGIASEIIIVRSSQ